MLALSNGPARPGDLRPSFPEMPEILLNDVCGWFVRTERGIYALPEEGRAILARGGWFGET